MLDVDIAQIKHEMASEGGSSRSAVFVCQHYLGQLSGLLWLLRGGVESCTYLAVKNQLSLTSWQDDGSTLPFKTTFVYYFPTRQETPFFQPEEKEEAGLPRSYLWKHFFAFFPTGIVLVSPKVLSHPSSLKRQNKMSCLPLFWLLHFFLNSRSAFKTHTPPHVFPSELRFPLPVGEWDASWRSSSEHKRLNCRVNHFPTQIAFRMQQSGLGGENNKVSSLAKQ